MRLQNIFCEQANACALPAREGVLSNRRVRMDVPSLAGSLSEGRCARAPGRRQPDAGEVFAPPATLRFLPNLSARERADARRGVPTRAALRAPYASARLPRSDRHTNDGRIANCSRLTPIRICATVTKRS